MTEFTYDNAKNASIGYTLFELNCGFHLQVLFEKDIDHHFRSRLTNKLVNKLRKLIKICCQNLFHA